MAKNTLIWVTKKGSKMLDNIQVGTIVSSKYVMPNVKIGDIGVCYEEYIIGDRKGCSFIFQSGFYDGFSPQEMRIFLKYEGYCDNLSDYEFQMY